MLTRQTWGLGFAAIVALSGGCSSAGEKSSKEGYIYLFSNPQASQPEMSPSDAFVFFQETVAGSAPEVLACTELASVGDCHFDHCIYDSGPVPAPPRGRTFRSGGHVSVLGGKQPLQFDGQLNAATGQVDYPALMFTTALWDGGELMSVNTTGSPEFPAIQGSFNAPHPLVLIQPVLSAGFSIETASDLELAWSSPTAGVVSAELSSSHPTSTGTETWTVVCSWPAGPATGSIPAQLMSQLRTHADANQSYLLNVGSMLSTTFLSGAVGLRVQADVSTPSVAVALR